MHCWRAGRVSNVHRTDGDEISSAYVYSCRLYVSAESSIIHWPSHSSLGSCAHRAIKYFVVGCIRSYTRHTHLCYIDARLAATSRRHRVFAYGNRICSAFSISDTVYFLFQITEMVQQKSNLPQACIFETGKASVFIFRGRTK